MAEQSEIPIPTLFKHAMQNFNAGRHEIAREGFRSILGRDEALPEVHFQLGKLESARGDAAASLTHYRRARDLKPTEPIVWMGLLDGLIAHGREKDIRAYLKELARAPLPDQVKDALRRKERQRNKGGEATVAASDMAEVKRAIAEFEAGRFADAAARAGALHARSPRSAVIATILASAKAALGDLDDADAMFRKAVSLDPGYLEGRLRFTEFLYRAGRAQDALAQIGPALKLAPDSPDANRIAALVYAAQSRHPKAKAAAEKALAANPKDVEVLTALGSAQAGLGAPFDALETLEKAAALGADTYTFHRAHGRILSELDRTADARTALEAALAHAPEDAAVLIDLATIYSQAGKHEESRAYLDRARAVDPKSGTVYYRYATDTKITEGDSYTQYAVELYETASEAPGTRIPLAFGLAKAMEDQKHHEKVFPYLDAANEALTAEFPHDADAYHLRHAEPRSVYEKGIVSNEDDPSPTTAAPIFIVGLPRSGTTLIEQIISSHPDVRPGGEASILFRSLEPLISLSAISGKPILRRDIIKAGHDAAAQYDRLIPGPGRVTDKAVNTIPNLGFQIEAMPDAAFIVVRRDPRDNCLSMYKNQFRRGMHTYSQALDTLAQHYIHFEKAVAFWRDACPGRFTEVSYEAITTNQEEETRKLIAACGLPWDDACLAPQDNKRRIRTLSVAQARQAVYTSSVKGWKRYEAELQPLIRALEAGGIALD